MGLRYTIQNAFVLVGSKDSSDTISEVALPTSYNTSVRSTFPTEGASKLDIAISYTMGSGETSNSIETKVEASPDNTNFFRIANESVSAGTSTLTAREFTFVGANAANATISIGLDIFYRFVRVSFKESGVNSNNGTVFAEATLSR